MNDPNPCPMCGSPVKFDATSASEMYGHSWQTLYIMCNKQNDPHCCMSLDLESDADYIEYAADALVECWNKLRSKK